jgi:hypothetical protein
MPNCWRVVSASVAGTSHLERNTECQDTHECLEIPSGDESVLVVIASDGAGSAEKSLAGAEIACQLFVQEIKTLLTEGGNLEDLTEEFGRELIAHIQTKIAAYAEGDNLTSRDYACTLLAAVIGKEAAVFYQIGDGALVYATGFEANRFCFGIEPRRSEYVNVTNFVTDHDAPQMLQFNIIDKQIDDVAIFTDGLQQLAIDFQDMVPHAPFFTPMLAPLRNGNAGAELKQKLSEFLASQAVNKRTDDDKTLILASRRRLDSVNN